MRFNELRQSLRGVPPATLAERLVQLERAGILHREIVPSRPPHVEYVLTERGRELAALIERLRGWAGSALVS